MNRSEIEQLTDELIGEAVLSLLKEHSPIGKQTLVTRLKTMEASEKDGQRRDAIASVITEISAGGTPFARRKTAPDPRELDEMSSGNNDNVFPLFGHRKPKGSSNIH